MDTVIRRRLMTDGEGAGDERRITMVHKQLIKFANSTGKDSNVNGSMLRQTAQSLVDHLDYSLEKTLAVNAVCQQEAQQFNSMYQQFETQLSSAQQSIIQCKKELQQAKQVRKHRQEYDAVAHLIEGHPDRKLSIKKISELENVREEQVKELERLEHKMELRKKQLYVLVKAANSLSQQLSDEEIEDSECESKETTPKPTDKMDQS